MRSIFVRGSRYAGGCGLLLLSIFLCLSSSVDVPGQTSINYTGNGGRHAVQGRIYTASGRRTEFRNIQVKLVNLSAGDLTVFADSNGFFSFKNLTSGAYAVVVEGQEGFEDFRENVFIDDLGSSSMGTGGTMKLPPTARTMNVQVYLKPKASDPGPPARVLNAKWATVKKDAVNHYERGTALIRAAKYSDAEAEFRSALAIEPNFGPAHTELGIIQQRNGRLDDAIASWKTALRLDEKDFEAHLNLGVAYLNLKRYPECETELVSAAFIDRTAITPHYYLGMLYVVKDDLTVARKAFETARDLNGGKTLPAVHKYLGRVYMAMNMNKEALRELQAYLELVPAAQDAERVRKDISDVKSRTN